MRDGNKFDNRAGIRAPRRPWLMIAAAAGGVK